MPWDSMGSEFEVEEEVVLESRPKVMQMVMIKVVIINDDAW